MEKGDVFWSKTWDDSVTIRARYRNHFLVSHGGQIRHLPKSDLIDPGEVERLKQFDAINEKIEEAQKQLHDLYDALNKV